MEEAISWGKVSPKAKKKVVYVDATIALPLIAHGLFEEGLERSSPLDLSWIFNDLGG